MAIIELKVVASTNTLGQLLLYTRAVRNRLRREGWPGQVRGLLITTHLDSNVADVVSELQSIEDLTLKVCVGTEPGALRLVEPREAPPEQIWDHLTVGGRCGVCVVGGKVLCALSIEPDMGSDARESRTFVNNRWRAFKWRPRPGRRERRRR